MPAEFTALQTLARFFLQAEYALAVIVIGEEFPARLRGRAIGLLTAFATIGVMVMAKVQPFVLLPAGAEGNWLHDVALAGVAALQGAFGLAEDRSELARALLPRPAAARARSSCCASRCARRGASRPSPPRARSDRGARSWRRSGRRRARPSAPPTGAAR